jgi:hypothetical protein
MDEDEIDRLFGIKRISCGRALAGMILISLVIWGLLVAAILALI